MKNTKRNTPDGCNRARANEKYLTTLYTQKGDLSIKMFKAKIRYTYHKFMDRLITGLEKVIFDETYHDVDDKRLHLESKVEELENQISYLTERNDI